MFALAALQQDKNARCNARDSQTQSHDRLISGQFHILFHFRMKLARLPISSGNWLFAWAREFGVT